MAHRLSPVLALGVLLTPRLALAADEWSVNEATLPSGAEEKAASNDVIRKWCEENGSRVRFSNTSVPGYRECGTLAVSAQCDAGGKKFIGPSSAAPHDYRDCSSGPRIYIKRHDEPLEGVVDQPVATVPTPEMPAPVMGSDLSSRGGAPLAVSESLAAKLSTLSPQEVEELLRALRANPELRDAVQGLPKGRSSPRDR